MVPANLTFVDPLKIHWARVPLQSYLNEVNQSISIGGDASVMADMFTGVLFSKLLRGHLDTCSCFRGEMCLEGKGNYGSSIRSHQRLGPTT